MGYDKPSPMRQQREYKFDDHPCPRYHVASEMRRETAMNALIRRPLTSYMVLAGYGVRRL